jgi:large subunit ribosomal protein L32
LPAVPKNKRSRSNKNARRNSFKLKPVNIVECPRCHAKKIAHRVCESCGYYNNVEIIQKEEKSKEKGKGKEPTKTKA